MRFDATCDKRASFDALFLRCHTRTYLISSFLS
ncbi:elongation factor tu [Yersinia sp. KBS0713]|nr:elongation factor tu [Yersinia sp. KBS0713]